MVKFIKVQVGPAETATYARLSLKDDAELSVFMGNTVRVLQQKNPLAAVTVEEVSYSEGMRHILSEVAGWPTWRKAWSDGHLQPSWDNLSN